MPLNFDFLFQIEKKFELQALEVGLQKVHALSPKTVYFLNQTKTEVALCASEMCSNEYAFKWHGSKQCKANFLCTKLSQNACGDYGIVLKDWRNNNGSEDEDVCYDHILHKRNIENGDEIEIQLWLNNGTRFDADCFLWCTATGSIPEDAAVKNDDLLENLVRK